MTEENYNYRTSQTLLRNQFPGKGKLQIPIIPKFQEKPADFDDLLLIGFDKTHLEDQNHLNRMVHFFLYDYRFERVWKSPDSDIEKLSRYRAVLSPDFSMYLEMAKVCQIYNVFRNRWCGAYWASKGIRVIPTVNWGDESTFDFCFEGIEKGSVVAVSTYMASEHDNRCDQKEWFMAGYSDHGNSSKHSIPHDHDITWEGKRPSWGDAQNYRDGNIPDFKSYWRYNMTYRLLNSHNSLEDNRFKTISDFKWCMRCGGEVELEWNGIHFGIVPYGKDKKISIYLWNRPETEQIFNTADDALEYMVGSNRLRDVITQVTVLDRTI